MDIYRYPAQFIRLKKQQWQKINKQWESGYIQEDQFESQVNVESGSQVVNPFSQLFKQRSSNNEEEYNETKRISVPPKTGEELKRLFLDALFLTQIKWASSTIDKRSFVEDQFYDDFLLKYLLQSFPDTYLVLYRPVFFLKNAPVELEIIIITSVAVWCIVFLEGESDSVYTEEKGRFWAVKNGKEKKKIVSPLIGLNRTGQITQQILQKHKVELPIKKAIISRTGYVDGFKDSYDLSYIDKKLYPDWFSGMRSISSPLKSVQLKAAQSLLSYCHTTYIKRHM
ncbi:NERD domain-containing protein [Litchfieldia alkalitelluris]|uniref:NERD domain-containing protein n=1 Tax=Litchfieldia alkalitelluris TaxID=304268 RepID=UPI001F1DC601|nr:NERD domain-containing protein [Litchfieldia alkalitelluris]